LLRYTVLHFPGLPHRTLPVLPRSYGQATGEEHVLNPGLRAQF